ncbi:hypothetical protein Tco_1272776 [Tanacetum coccineum]
MTLSIGTIAAIVDDATRQSLNDLVHKLVNTGVDRLIQDLLSQRPESSNAGNNRILENVDNIAEDCKVNLVSIHLFDLALMWHKLFAKFMRDNVDWNVYRRAILKIFDVAYDDPLGEIKNLKLSTETELAVRMFKPRTLAEVYGLCKLEEAKVNAVKQKPKPPILSTPRYQNQFPNIGPKPMALPAPNATWRTKPVTRNIPTYFKELRMEFKYNGKKVLFKGTSKRELQWMQGSKMHIQTTSVELSYMVLCMYPTTTLHMIKSIESQQVPEKITYLLHHYSDGYSIPTTFPPKRPFDHKNPLKEGTVPINSKPYRHPQLRKMQLKSWLKNYLILGNKR